MVFAPKKNVLAIDQEQAKKQLALLGYKSGDNVYLTAFFPKGDPRTKGESRDKGRKAERLSYSEIEGWQAEGRGVYLVVNGYGHGKADVKNCRAIFYEHDDLDKNIQLTLWQSLNLPEPTVQVDTGGKSIHSYWVFDQPIHPELWAFDQGKGNWKGLQADLLKFANADKSLVNPNRVMRLAGCWYMVNDDSGTHAMAKSRIVGGCGEKYSYNELRGIIPRSEPPEAKQEKRSLSNTFQDTGEDLLDFRTVGHLLPHWNDRGRSGWATFQCPVHTSSGKHSDDHIHVNLSTGEWKAHCECNRKLIYKAVCEIAGHKQKPTGRGYSSGISGGNRRNFGGGSGGSGGGDGGDSGDSKVIRFPSIQELTESQVKVLINEIIEQGLTGGELNAALNGISHRTPWRIDQLYKLHQQKLEDIERIELRDNTREQLESLLSASNASLDLHDFLHPNLAKPLIHIASRLSLKPEVYLTALLITASSLHNPNTRIWLSKEDDFDQPAGLYGAIIAPSSQKKSPVLKVTTTKPLKVLDAEERENYKRKLDAYHREMQEWEELSKEEKKETDPPVKPERAIHYFTKTNGEGLDYQVPRQPDQGLLYLADELVSIVNSQNQYRQGKGSDRQDLLSYYDGIRQLTLRADGVKSEFEVILLSILGGIQPKVMQSLLQNCEDSDGSWARFIFVHQPAVAGRLHADGGRIDLTELLVDLYRKIRALPTVEYTLTPEAFKLFQSAYDRYEQNRVNDPLPGMQSVWGKCEGRVGRLALNLHVINSLANGDIPTEQIGSDTIRRAIALTDYYAMQVKALYTEFSDSDALAPHLAKVIEMSLKSRKSKSEGWLKASDVYLAITKKHRPSPETVREWFSELVLMGKGEVKGEGRSLQFRVFSDKHPPTPPVGDQSSEKLDDLRQELDKSSNAESTIYQPSQELLDKLDDLDNFPQHFMDVEALEVKVDLTNEVEKTSLLDESSNLSNFVQDVQPETETALDKSSNESSNLDALDTKEAVADEQTPQSTGLPLYQRSDGGFELQSFPVITAAACTITVQDTIATLASAETPAELEAVGDDQIAAVWSQLTSSTQIKVLQLTGQLAEGRECEVLIPFLKQQWVDARIVKVIPGSGWKVLYDRDSREFAVWDIDSIRLKSNG